MSNPIPKDLRERFDLIERDIMGDRMDRCAVFTEMRAVVKTHFSAYPAVAEVVAVIGETDHASPETDVIHRPGIDSLPVGTELVDRAHVTRLQAELAALKSKLGEAYEWGYGDGQNNPNGYSSEADRDKCIAELTATAKQEV